MICTKYPKTYSLSCDQVTDAMTIIGLLYVRNKKKEMKIYKLPVKNFAEYEVGKVEGYKNIFSKKPESRYLVQGSKKVKKQDSYDGSTSSKSNSKSNDSSEESKSPVKSDDFRRGDSGIDLGNKLYEKLGEKFVEKQQVEMIDPKSSLIYRDRMKDHKAIQLRYGDIAVGKIDIHLGDSSGVIEWDSEDESNPSKETYDDEKSNSDKNSDSDDEVKLSDFKLIKMLNQGAFGKVFLARNTVDGQYYAMKRIRKDLLIKTKQIENTLSEKNILLMNNIPFLLGMKYVFKTEFRLYFMLDYINGGNLYENLKRVRRFSEDETKFIIAQVVIAIAYLHKNKIIHRDLKPENVMMRENGYWVLADFGLSKTLKSKNDLSKSCVGTDEYMAPELIRREGHSFTLDWWTVGILTYELAVGRSPFLSKNPRKIHSNIWKNEIPWPDPERHRIYISDTMKDFIEKLLEKEPKYRLGAKGPQEVFKHEWLSDIDFDKMLNFKVKAPYKPRIDRIDEEKDEDLLSTYQKRKKDEEKKALLETWLGESRKQLIRDYQDKFKEF